MFSKFVKFGFSSYRFWNLFETKLPIDLARSLNQRNPSVLILSMCGHPCLREWWVGSSDPFSMDNSCPTQTPSGFFPPEFPCKILLGLKKQSSWNHCSHHFLIFQWLWWNLPEWTKPTTVVNPFGHRETSNLSPDQSETLAGKSCFGMFQFSRADMSVMSLVLLLLHFTFSVFDL